MTSAEFVPTWAKGIVWYQIFPERFANGDPTNDPTLADQAGAWPYDQQSPYAVHRWTADWYARAPYEQHNGLDLWQTLSRRRYGGDLQGIIDKLDYLHDLGVGALYLNPVFWAASHHKYDGNSYHHVDPTFGPDPAGDCALIAQEQPWDPMTWVWTAADKLLLELVRQAHARGMRVILDGVFNHMGTESWAFQDVRRRQQASPVADWFKIKAWDDPQAGTTFEYEGWFGVPDLPELSQDENGLTAGPRDYVFACTRRWMDPDGDGDPADGIDGWRLDVAFCIAHPFWKAWRAHVRKINPEAYLVAEVVRPIEQTQPYLQGDEFDAVMNYDFAWTACEWLVQTNVRTTTVEFDRQLHQLIAAFPAGVAHVMQNLYDSHDSARLATHIVNRDRFDYRDWFTYHVQARASTTPDIATRPPTDAERRLQKLAVILQMTYVGAPMIYYGDEAGMWGANDPDCRKPMVWPELTYDPQAVAADERLLATPYAVAFDHDLHAFYRQLIQIHNGSPALRLGSFVTRLIENDVYAFERVHAGDRAVIVLNRGADGVQVTLPMAAGNYRDAISGTLFTMQADGQLKVSVPGVWGVILQPVD